MFTLYTVLLTLHILAVVAWVGGGLLTQIVSVQARDDPSWPKLLAGFAPRYFPALSGVAALTGVLLWIDGPWDFGELWVLLAVAGWIVSSAIGATQLTPLSERWAGGDVVARDRFLKITRVDLVILVLVVADMVIKPGL